METWTLGFILRALLHPVIRLVLSQSQVQLANSVHKVHLRSIYLLQALTLVHIKILLFSYSPWKAAGLAVKLDNRMCVLCSSRPAFDAQLRGKDSNKHKGKISWKILGHYKKLCSWKTQKFQLPLLPDTYASSKDKWDMIYQQISLGKLGEL